MFFFNRPKSLAIAQIHKAGSQSFTEWLRWSVCESDFAATLETRVAFFRHPLERPKAAYSMWCYSGQTSFVGGDWHHMVDRILDENWKNEHFIPQVQIVGDVPTIYHRFEDVNELYEKYWPGHLPKMNHWSRMPDIDNYREDELLAYYADDLVIWENANAT